MKASQRERMGLTAALALALCACGSPRHASQPQSKPPKEPPSEEKISVTVKGGEIVLSDQQGQRVLEGEADSMTYDAERKLGTFQHGRCAFLEKGKVVTVAQAPLIVVDYQTDQVRMSGGVLARSQVHRSAFRADQAVWDTKQKRVHATGNVRFLRDQGSAYSVVGPSLDADTELRRVVMPKVHIRMVEVPAAKRGAPRRR